MQRLLIRSALLLGVPFLTVACYQLGLTGHFIFDDGANIRLNPSLGIDNLDPSTLWNAANSGGGLLSRPISLVSFAVNYYFFGMTPYSFKAVNLAIHLVNGMLVFTFVRLLLSLHLRIRGAADDSLASWIGLAVAALWLLHPFNLTNVLYVVQRMNSLSAMFMLAGLTLYLHGRQRVLCGARWGTLSILAALFAFTPLAALCKENGVLLPWLILTSETTLLRWNAPNPASQHALKAIVGLTALAPLLISACYLLHSPGLIVDGYAWRDFTLTERLMTEARVLWFYLHMILLPSMAEMGLHHDDYIVSTGLLSPWTTLPAVAGLLLLVLAAVALRNSRPLVTFGIAFFLVGHALESTVLPLELAFEHRNYLPMLGILLPVSHYALNPQLHPPTAHVRRLAFFLLLFLFAGLTATRAYQWGDTFQMRLLEVERHPNSVRAHTDLANLYDHLPPTSNEEAMELYRKARHHYQQAADNSQSSVSGLFGIFAINAERNLPVDEDAFGLLEQRLATVPFGPPNKNSLIGALRDIGSGYFAANADIVARLYRAAMSNPKLTGNIRNQVATEFESLPPEIRPKAK